MEVESLKDYLIANKEELLESLLQGRYRPNPVRRVEIPKENGKEKFFDTVNQSKLIEVLSRTVKD